MCNGLKRGGVDSCGEAGLGRKCASEGRGYMRFDKVRQEVCKGTMGMRPLETDKAAKVFCGWVRCGAARLGRERQEMCSGKVRQELVRSGGIGRKCAAVVV